MRKNQGLNQSFPGRKDANEGYQNATFWGIMNQAVAAMGQDRPWDAVTAYRHALEANPNNKDAMNGLANAYFRAADYPDAAKMYYQLTASYPTDAVNWLGLSAVSSVFRMRSRTDSYERAQ